MKLNKRIEEAAKINQAPVVMLPQGEAFLRMEITRLRERVANMYRRNEDLLSACNFYLDKSDTLEKMCVENGLMKSVRL